MTDPPPQHELRLVAPARLEHPGSGEFRYRGLGLVDLLGDTAGRLVIDLTPTVTADSSGLEALIAIRRRALRRGHRLVLRGVGPGLAALLELTKLKDLFAGERADRL